MTALHPGLRRAADDGGVRARSLHLALLAASGLLLALAFPRPGVGWLAHWALVPAAVLALRSTSAWRLAWTSYAVWLAWWVGMLYWLWPVTGGGYLGLALLMAAYPTAALLVFRHLDRKWKLPAVVTLPLAWVTMEALRGHLFAGGFAWYHLSHTQASFDESHGPRYVVQAADLFGEYGVSWLVAMTNGLVVDLCLRPWSRPVRGATAAGRRPSRAVIGAVVLWAVLLGGAWVYGRARVQQWDAVATPGPVVAVVQTNVPQDNRNRPTREQTLAEWQRLLQLTTLASTAAVGEPGATADLIVWPETVTPTGLNDEAVEVMPLAAAVLRETRAAAQRTRAHLVIGSNALWDWRPVERDGEQYLVPAKQSNSAFFMFSDGMIAGRYDKMHRVPFGEFLPWIEWFPALKGLFLRYLSPYGPDFDYTVTPGLEPVIFVAPFERRGGEGGVVRFATPICFEDAVSRVGLRMVYEPEGGKRADLLVNLTNDGWFVNTAQAVQHVQIATLRCIELRVPMARAVNTGVSGLIDSVGRVGPLVRDDSGQTQDVDGATAARIRLDPRASLFGRVGQVPVWIMIGGTGALVLVGTIRKGS